MKKKFFITLSCTIIAIFFLSCTDIFEVDLTGTKIEVIAPCDSLITKEKTQRFWWNYSKGALWYELQVVSPNFSKVSSVRLDTTIETNNFQLSLQPGVYHWRIRAINGSSSSDYTEYLLIILESLK